MGSSNQNNRQIFDTIRRLWVKATPEEIVRQAVLRKMVEELGYPRELISVEREIGELLPEGHLSAPQRRIDIVCFTKNLRGDLRPLILIECKAERLNKRALDQAVGYNYLIRAPYLSVVTPYEEVTGHWDQLLGQYQFRRGFPNYPEIT